MNEKQPQPCTAKNKLAPDAWEIGAVLPATMRWIAVVGNYKRNEPFSVSLWVKHLMQKIAPLFSSVAGVAERRARL